MFVAILSLIYFLMDKYNEIYGVDISKDVFDVMNSKGKYVKLSNDESGFKKLAKAKKDSLILLV